MRGSLPITLGLFSTLFYSLAQITIKSWLQNEGITGSIKASFLYTMLIVIFGMIGLALWILALKGVELNSIYWTTAFAYILVPLLAVLFLKENFGWQSLIGYFLITIGAILASTTE